LAALAFTGNAVTGQGSSGAIGTASQVLDGVGGSGQGAQSNQVTAGLTFSGGVATVQGGQSSTGTDADGSLAGTGASGQGSQETDGAADAELAVAYTGAGRSRVRRRLPPQIGGQGESAQSSAQTNGREAIEIGGQCQSGQGPGAANGFARVLLPIVGTGTCTQGLGRSQGQADVDNRIPRNRQKARIAAALLLAA
jgi:hypothetical protein